MNTDHIAKQPGANVVMSPETIRAVSSNGSSSSRATDVKSRSSGMSSTITQSRIYNQSVNEAYTNVLRARNVSEYLYSRNLMQTNHRGSTQRIISLPNLPQNKNTELADTYKENQNSLMIERIDDLVGEDVEDVDENLSEKQINFQTELRNSRAENDEDQLIEAKSVKWDDVKTDTANSRLIKDDSYRPNQSKYSSIDGDESESEDSNVEEEDYEYQPEDEDKEEEDDEDDDDNLSYISDDDYDDINDYNVVAPVYALKKRLRWGRIVFSFFLLGVFFHLLFKIPNFNHLNNQIKELYQDRVEIEKSVSVILEQMEKQIKNRFNTYASLHSASNTDSSPVNVTDIELKVYSQIEKNLFERLDSFLPLEIPVIIKKNDYDNGDKILILPEFESFLKESVFSSGSPDYNTNSDSTVEQRLNDGLKYDMNEYIKEILLKEYQFVDKQFFLNELYKNIDEVKSMVMIENNKINQIKMENENGNNNNNNNGKDNYNDEYYIKQLVKEEFLKELERKTVYDFDRINNEQQSQLARHHKFTNNDLNYATFSTGTRIINHLCSKTFHGLVEKGVYSNEIEPIELLSDYFDSSVSTITTNNQDQEDHTGSNNYYWLCDISSKSNSNNANPLLCQWTIRFKQPIYLLEIRYQHGRFKNNLSLMNSSPKTISLFVKFQKNDHYKQLVKQFGNEIVKLPNDRSYLKISELNYDLTDNLKTTQQFKLPRWFIELKPLIKSISFVVDGNYGNPYFISLNKFIVNGITPYDLELIALHNKEQDQHFKNNPSSPGSLSYVKQSSAINSDDSRLLPPSFGDDEVIL